MNSKYKGDNTIILYATAFDRETQEIIIIKDEKERKFNIHPVSRSFNFNQPFNNGNTIEGLLSRLFFCNLREFNQLPNSDIVEKVSSEFFYDLKGVTQISDELQICKYIAFNVNDKTRVVFFCYCFESISTRSFPKSNLSRARVDDLIQWFENNDVDYRAICDFFSSIVNPNEQIQLY